MKKTNTTKTIIFTSTILLTLSIQNALARDNDERDGYRRNRTPTPLSLYSKVNEVKTIPFMGKIQIPSNLKVVTLPGRESRLNASLILDDSIQCLYEGKFDRRNTVYSFLLKNCSNGARAGESIEIDNKITLSLKDTSIIPSAIYASIPVLEKHLKGIKLPNLVASKGQVLKYEGEGLWVPSDILPDGLTNGDVLSWDGSAWIATHPGASSGGSTSGPQGPQGPQGLKGDKGDQGVQGPIGLTGAQGLQGPQGLKGDKGDQGIQGPIGLIGAQGLQGPQGLKGDKGDQGIQGPIGLTGAQGLQGPQGPQGLPGAPGNPGLVKLTAGSGIVGTEIIGNGGTIAVNTGTGVGQIPVIESNGQLPASIIPDNSQKIAFIRDQKPNGTDGGTFNPSSGWEQIRELNTLTGDRSFVSLNANQFTLLAGTYIIEAAAPAFLDGLHKAVLVNMANQNFVLIGTNARSHNVGGGMEASLISGQLILSSATTFAIKHRCSSLMSTIGFGAATNFGVDEVYTQVKITKVK